MELNKSMIEINKIYNEDCLTGLKKLPDHSIDCCVTSPPYWALRDYGVDGQLGLEPTYNEYITKLCDIFDEVKRVLKKEGTCWVNLGDTYNSHKTSIEYVENFCNKQLSNGLNAAGEYSQKRAVVNKNVKYPNKCLFNIPARFQIEMINRGWILRNVIIWHKKNCIPSSANDRFTVDFEYLFFFVKSPKYYFEQQFEDQLQDSINRLNRAISDKHKYLNVTGQRTQGMHKKRAKGQAEHLYNSNGRNKRTVWSINTMGYPEAHFATFPEKLIYIPIKAGCPENGIVLDPFMGSGTTAVVSKKLNRNYIGFELNPEYIKMADNRIFNEIGLFNQI